MGTQFEWKEEYNIGVDLIDKEHQELFQFINKLYLLTQKKWGWNSSRQSCRRGIDFFEKHAIEHFADEENGYAYPTNCQRNRSGGGCGDCSCCDCIYGLQKSPKGELAGKFVMRWRNLINAP